MSKVFVVSGGTGRTAIQALNAALVQFPAQEIEIIVRAGVRANAQVDDAVQFAFQHDDGQRPNEMHKAEIVLIGVSRTFKTPLSIYLAFKGWLVANVPIVLDLEPPGQLFELPPHNVFCLSTYAHNLAALRHSRAEHLGITGDHYANLIYVKRELNYAHSIFRRKPLWPIIRVIHKPIEEIAGEILAIRKNF